jgi:hypothetical protein
VSGSGGAESVGAAHDHIRRTVCSGTTVAERRHARDECHGNRRELENRRDERRGVARNPEGVVVVGDAGDGAADDEKERDCDTDDASPRRPHEQDDHHSDAEDDWAGRHRWVVHSHCDLPDDRRDADSHRQRVHLGRSGRRAVGDRSRVRCACHATHRDRVRCGCRHARVGTLVYVPCCGRLPSVVRTLRRCGRSCATTGARSSVPGGRPTGAFRQARSVGNAAAVSRWPFLNPRRRGFVASCRCLIVAETVLAAVGTSVGLRIRCRLWTPAARWTSCRPSRTGARPASAGLRRTPGPKASPARRAQVPTRRRDEFHPPGRGRLAGRAQQVREQRPVGSHTFRVEAPCTTAGR